VLTLGGGYPANGLGGPVNYLSSADFQIDAWSLARTIDLKLGQLDFVASGSGFDHLTEAMTRCQRAGTVSHAAW
jgi:hypothetical protein